MTTHLLLASLLCLMAAATATATEYRKKIPLSKRDLKSLSDVAPPQPLLEEVEVEIEYDSHDRRIQKQGAYYPDISGWKTEE